MGLTPKQSGRHPSGGYEIATSAQVSSMTCPANVAPGSAGGTVSLWFKPSGTPGGVLSDQTRWHHVHMQGTAAAMDVTLNGESHGTLSAEGATTYAEVLANILTQCAGSAEGYMAQLHVVHNQRFGAGCFGRTIKGNWVPKRVGTALNFAPDPDFSEGTAGGWEIQKGAEFTSSGVDFSGGEQWAGVQLRRPTAFKKDDRRLLVCSTVDSITRGTLRAYTYPSNNDGSYKENVGQSIKAPGHYRDIIFTDDDSVNVGINALTAPCDGILSKLDILDMVTGPAYAPGSGRLVFEDATALGEDSSGNDSGWTLEGAKQTKDAPLNNHCVFNPADTYKWITLADGNLSVVGNIGWSSSRSSVALPATGKVYWETASSGAAHVYGIATKEAPLVSYIGTNQYSYGFQPYYKKFYYNRAATSFPVSGYALGDTVGLLWDGDTGSLSVVYDNAGIGTIVQGLTGTWFIAHSCKSVAVAKYNFGATPFVYDIPEGAVALTKA